MVPRLHRADYVLDHFYCLNICLLLLFMPGDENSAIKYEGVKALLLGNVNPNKVVIYQPQICYGQVGPAKAGAKRHQ
jgi:hypothetical protein